MLSRKIPKATQARTDVIRVKTLIEIPLSEEEWSMLNAAADSIASSPEELARISLVQRCMVMSEDDEVCERTREMVGFHVGVN